MAPNPAIVNIGGVIRSSSDAVDSASDTQRQDIEQARKFKGYVNNAWLRLKVQAG